MNWRLSASELTKIIENGNPTVVIVDGDLSELGKQVQAETDLVREWFEYGEIGDQSFESLILGQSSLEPPQASNHIHRGQHGLGAFRCQAVSFSKPSKPIQIQGISTLL